MSRSAASELAGQPASTESGDWRIETEGRAVLKMSKQERDMFFNSREDENGKTLDRDLTAIQGPKAAEEIKATMERLQAA